MADRTGEGLIAVFDVGKTHLKLSITDVNGEILTSRSTDNITLTGRYWRHHDTQSSFTWLMMTLADLARDHPICTIVPVGHGSCGALVGPDVEVDDEPVLPMIDYESPLAPEIAAAYAPLCGSFAERGSALMMGTSHMARQLFVMQHFEPEAVARATAYVALPQYWAWRLSGVAVREATAFGAQSHLVNVATGQDAAIVAAQGWSRLLPPWAKAWQDLGPIRPSLATRFGLPDTIRILAGIHDSSANLYRYRAAGLDPVTVVSTGTWIVALAGGGTLDHLDESRGMTINADVDGRPVPGVLSMAGREFGLIAGQPDGAATEADLMQAVRANRFALPGLTADDGLFPGSAGKGCVIGAPPQTGPERRALALLFGAAMTAECLDALGHHDQVILDGAFIRDPLYAGLVAAMTSLPVRVHAGTDGVAAGAALLAGHLSRQGPAPLVTEMPLALNEPGLYRHYWQQWRALARDNARRPQSDIRTATGTST